MDRGRVREDRGSKETDRCPLIVGVVLQKVDDSVSGKLHADK
jgi:hypothetical protein